MPDQPGGPARGLHDAGGLGWLMDAEVAHALPEGYALTLQQRDGYLYAHLTGPRDTFSVSITYWSAIVAKCRKLSVRRLLVLEELAERAARYDMYEMVHALVELGFSDIRIAYVDPSEDPMLLRYAEHVAADVGLTGQAFVSMEPALSWLMAREEPTGRDAPATTATVDQPRSKALPG